MWWAVEFSVSSIRYTARLVSEEEKNQQMILFICANRSIDNIPTALSSSSSCCVSAKQKSYIKHDAAAMLINPISLMYTGRYSYASVCLTKHNTRECSCWMLVIMISSERTNVLHIPWWFEQEGQLLQNYRLRYSPWRSHSKLLCISL